MLVGNESWGPNWENPRSVYACEDLDGVIEFCDTKPLQLLQPTSTKDLD